ncbi:alpha/beta fold hydrolase [Sphingobium sp. ZW T5_29]|uniref:alpha/beta fold hydrolase n=1 Tax=Sphingobium sp. ZW T5_29 TaxID=3378077 RepID=UPI0038539F8A
MVMMSVEAAKPVFLPGLLCDSRVFAAQMRRFPDAFVIDGFGACDSIAAMARRVIATGPDRMSLLGHSMGARVALEVIRLAPERVERLALVSTGTHMIRPGEAEKRHALLALGQEQGAAALIDRWLPPMVAPARRADQALIMPLHRMAVEVGIDTYAAQIAALLARPEVECLLPRIACPTLVAVGEDDEWSPPEQHRFIADRIPGAHLKIIAGSGHMLPVEAPDALNEAIADWLETPAGSIITMGEDE